MSAGGAIEVVWRIESARLIAGLARLTGDVGLAEDLAQDALVAALERWPEAGVPENPGAWLMATAKNRAIDLARRGKRFDDRREQLAHEAGLRMAMDAAEHEAAVGDELGDELLGLIFTCCHPLLSTEARVALTLRLLGGLSTEEIARAFLISESAVAQRIVRAKRTLREAHAPFEVPRGEQLDERLPSVLEVVYLVFNEGYAATAGESWMRLDLCEEALRLGRVLAGLAPKQPEVHGLVALMEIQASRARARTGPRGEPVLLLEQDRARWDPLLVQRGLAALERAEKLGRGAFGPYTVQAAIAACHARARSADETDWERIAALYDALARLTSSPVVELNRAVAVSMAFGPDTGLELVEALAAEESLQGYHLLHSVRGDLLAKLGRPEEARQEFERAAAMTENARERELLLERAHLAGRSSDRRFRSVTEAAYDRIGVGYSAVRRPEPRIAARLEAALGDAKSVLNVGAGTGSYEPSDRDVTAVEPSRTMLAQRRPGSAPVVEGVAEDLPFEDDSFDAAMAIITVHHWKDVGRGLSEMVRVARQRVVVLSFDPAPIRDLWLVRDYFPGALEYHAGAMPPIDELTAMLPGATVEAVPIPRDCVDGFFIALWDRPEMHLDPDVRRASSVWHQMPQVEIEQGLAKLRADLESGRWDERNGRLRDLPELDVGLRLLRARFPLTRIRP